MDRRPFSLTVNGRPISIEIEPNLFLAEVLRERLGLTGTHVGCDTTQCGCCTVLLDGLAVKSCTVLALQVDGRDVTTIEGLSDGAALHPMQQAFIDHHGLQCGFCTPGMIMSAVALVRESPELDRDAARHGLEGNICRCTGYLNIVDAVLDGAHQMRDRVAEGAGPHA